MPARKPPIPSKKSCLESIEMHEWQIRDARKFYKLEEQKEVQLHLDAIQHFKKILKNSYQHEVPNGKE